VGTLSCDCWIFEIRNAFRSAMVLQVNDLLAKHGLNVHVITYVKKEGNFSAMIFFSLSILLCFGVVCTFCRDLLGPHTIEVLLVCHK